MPSFSRKIITLLVLTSFVTIVFFSFAFMLHGQDGHMSSDCPLFATGTEVCLQNNLATAVHYISSYHSFLNVPLNAGLASLIGLLLGAVCVILVIFIRPPITGTRAFVCALSDFPPVDSRRQKIARWLSLFEHSPSRL